MIRRITMEYERYKMKKGKFYDTYFYVVDKETQISTMIPTLYQVSEFFKEKYDIDMDHDELKVAKDLKLNMTEQKYKDFAQRFFVGHKKYEQK
jgi:GTP1/Obg family GTP-binding protein